MEKIDLMDCCEECEHITHDKDGEETADCSDEYCKCHELKTSKELFKEMELQKRITEKKLFNTVYQWGKVGVVIDERCNTFQDLLKEIRMN